MAEAIAQAKKSDKPTFICCKTSIGQGSPNLAGTDKVHGAPLGAAEIAATRAAIGWEHAPFEIPADVYKAWDATTTGANLESDWNSKFGTYRAKYPKEAQELVRRMAGELPGNFEQTVDAYLSKCAEKAETIATRKASQNAIEALAVVLPEFMGGSADLTGSNLTNLS